jgi:hypothetical protein
MKDPRSIAAVDAAIAYGEGKIDDKELADAAYAAYVAAYADATAAAYAAAAAAAYTTATYAANATNAAAYNAADAATAADAAAAYVVARAENRKITAEICRKYLPIEIWNI